MAGDKLEHGQIYTRAQVKALMGGSPQGGILPATESNSILVYSDDEIGKRYGYVDGWLAEDDDAGPVFEYTGAGSVGDQSFTGQKGAMNKALLRHAEDGRALHLFTAEGKVEGTNTKLHRYIGEMALDETQPLVRPSSARHHRRHADGHRLPDALGRRPTASPQG